MSNIEQFIFFVFRCCRKLIISALTSAQWQEYKNTARKQDLYCAKKIAGIGQVEIFTANFDIKTQVWAPVADHSAVGHLVQPRNLETHMWKTMNVQMEDSQHLLKQLKDVKMLPQWMMDYAAAWEDVYKSKIKKTYDIGTLVLSAMQETMFMIRSRVSTMPEFEDKIRTSVSTWQNRNADFKSKCVDDQEVAMRLLFRYSKSSDIFCHIAGAILHKNQVCSQPGSFAATRLRHDLTNKIDLHIRQLDLDIENDQLWYTMLNKDLDDSDTSKDIDKFYLVVDHTQMEMM